MSRVNINTRILAGLAKVIVGDIGKKIVLAIAEKALVRDDELSELLQMNENEVRKILWVLSDHTIVSTRKEVDSETGWITYYWHLPTSQAKGLLYNILIGLKERLEKKLEYEKNNVFFWCGNKKCPRYTFDEATDYMFKCKYCGRSLKPFDNSELVAALTTIIGKINKGISELLSTKE